MKSNLLVWIRLVAITLFVVPTMRSFAEDWPMWRCDAQRTAASSEQLAGKPGLLWTRKFEPRQQAWDDPLNLDLMTYDRVFEPIVMDGRVFIGFNDDKLVALDAATGETLWSFYAEGPVRLPAAGWNGRVYFCSDDGYLYCVDAASGKLHWRFRGAPGGGHAIGNQRLTSAWPARGGPVVRDETVYFAASIWPFMGTFIYALDARSGEVRWVNDSTGSQYIKQPHSAPSFAGVGPQGALVATDKLLLVPGGRSVPAAFNREDGSFRYFEINASGKGIGGSFVTADEHHFYVHTRRRGTQAFKLAGGGKTDFKPGEPVLADGLLYTAAVDKGKQFVRCYDSKRKVVWQIPADASGDLIRAGDHLYAAGKEGITTIRLPGKSEPARVAWSLPVQGSVLRLLVADEKLFAVTTSGEILAFGIVAEASSRSPITQQRAKGQRKQPGSLAIGQRAAAGSPSHELLSCGDAEGYAFWFGAEDSPLIDALAARSPFVQLAVVIDNADVVDRIRKRLDASGVYGKVTAHLSHPQSFQPPKYVANMVFVDARLSATADKRLVTALYECVRPYGGVMHLLADDHREQLAKKIQSMDLEQARVETTEHGVLVRRVGALPGSADWTHLHGDVANTIKSNDRRVKLPLGVLWFGGNSNMDVLPRHGHGPTEQVVGGRLFVEGMNGLSARDVYTGRVLWQRTFKDLGNYGVYYDSTFKNTPLDPAYNQVHIPGANARGTNYVVTADRVYIVEGATCHVLDPATGKTLLDIKLPKDAAGNQKQWGYIGVYQDVLIGGMGFANYVERKSLTFEKDKERKGNAAGFGARSLDRAGSLALVGFDRHSGQQLWKVDATHSFWHNGIVAGGGRIYCLDKLPQRVEDALKRRGKSPPKTYRILAIDHHSGEPRWQIAEGVFGTWLGYSEAKDLLLQAGASTSDRLPDEVGRGMAVYSGKSGKLKWKKDKLKYAGPCILHNDWIITNASSYKQSAGAFRLDDGQQKMVPNPLTGELQPWRITRAYGCNNVLASEHLLTFRSGAAGFYDLTNDSGTGNFGGFKSGCTSNLVVANGVLNAPDYTRTCSCAYQNQTSLALVHMPELEMWTVNSAATVESKDKRVRRLGINFGAPGDRRDAQGRLWLEYPFVGGDAPLLSIRVHAGARFFRQHESTMAGRELPWVLASGAEGVTEVRIRMRLLNKVRLATGISVAHSADDAEENAKGQVDLDSSDLELVEEDSTQLVGLRFNKINLPRNAVIRNAYLQFTCDEPTKGATSLIITAENSGDAKRFSKTNHNLSLRPQTKSKVSWKPAEWAKADDSGGAQRTPDLTPLIREVIQRSDWKAGNSLALLISGAGKRVAGARDGKHAAKLIIDGDTVPLESQIAQRHRVRLFFAAPKTGEPDRRFDVYLQDKRLGEVQLNTDSPTATLEMDDVMIGDELRIRLTPHEGKPVLSGIEVIGT